MNVQTERLNWLNELLDIEDEAILIQITEIFDNYDKDFGNDLLQHVKTGIERGQKQAADGKLTPHDEVVKRYARYL